MNRSVISPRSIAVCIVALVGVTVLASIGAPAAQATNAADSGTAVQASLDSGAFAQQGGAADCTRCHSGTKASGINPKLCGECHEEAYQSWNGSGHADSLSTGQAHDRIMREEACQECHVESAIKDRTDIGFQTKQQDLSATDEPVTCEACHAPPSVGWFGHFGKGGDMLPPAGTGPHGSGDAVVAPAEIVCQSCHSNDVVLTLATEEKIGPHSAALTGSVDGTTNGDSNGDGNGETDDGATTTASPMETTTTTETQTPGFGAVAVFLGVLGGALLAFRRR